MRIIASSCLSVRPHGTNRLPLDAFWWNLISEYFSQICLESSSFIKFGQEKRVLYIKTHKHILSYHARFFLEFSQLCKTRPRTSGTAVKEMWRKSWSIIYTAKFDKANFDCSQRRYSFQQGTWSLRKSSARRHCIVSEQCVATDNEVFQRSHIARPWHSASSDMPLRWQWNSMLS